MLVKSKSMKIKVVIGILAFITGSFLAAVSEPSKPFIALVKYMDSCSYTLDTVSMQAPLKQFDEIAVYSMVYANTSLHQLLTNPEEYADGSIGNISVAYTADYDKTFAEVQQIWLYPWQLATTTEGLKRKGVVEEWSFATQEQAKEAYNFLIKEQDYLGFPYIKTAVYYVQCGAYLYVLHSNHSGVAYRHKKFAAYLENQCENIQNNSE